MKKAAEFVKNVVRLTNFFPRHASTSPAASAAAVPTSLVYSCSRVLVFASSFCGLRIYACFDVRCICTSVRPAAVQVSWPISDCQYRLVYCRLLPQNLHPSHPLPYATRPRHKPFEITFHEFVPQTRKMEHVIVLSCRFRTCAQIGQAHGGSFRDMEP